jgi:hypothetical protein
MGMVPLAARHNIAAVFRAENNNKKKVTHDGHLPTK